MNSKSYSATPIEPPSILETVLRVALCQPASCNLMAKSSCVHPLRRRNLMTCCRIKFSFFMATESESHAILSVLFHIETKCSLRFSANPPGRLRRNRHNFCPASATIFHRHVYSKPRDEVWVMGDTRCLAEWPASEPVKSGSAAVTPPVAAQIRKSGHYGFVTTLAMVFATILHGFTCASLGTHDGQGRNKVRFDKFPQGGTNPHLGKYFVGVIKPTADRRSNSHQ